jgi:hypothetical protein
MEVLLCTAMHHYVLPCGHASLRLLRQKPAAPTAHQIEGLGE